MFKKRKLRPIVLVFFFAGILLHVGILKNAWSQAARTAENAVKKSIQIQQKSQADRTRWEQEKNRLVIKYEQLLKQQALLDEENKTLSDQEKQLRKTNKALVQRKIELLRLQKELGPFLNTLHQSLETLIKTDPPFLRKERESRLVRLAEILNDTTVSINEKYRKVMEALFIEAEYGATIEVYQEKIHLNNGSKEGTLGNIFRLGRVSLFFLSLDGTLCGTYNPGEKEWQVLPESYLPAIRSAVEIGSKRRPADLMPLPVGRLARQGGAQ